IPDECLHVSISPFRIDETPPAAVVAELERRGAVVETQHVVGLCPAAVAIPAASGRLLEARLAASAARAGAERCSEHGGDEHEALAGRLRREADGLAAIGLG